MNNKNEILDNEYFRVVNVFKFVFIKDLCILNLLYKICVNLKVYL